MYVRFLGEGLDSRDAQMGSRFLCIRFGYSRTRFAGIIIGVRGVGGLVSFRGKDRAACDVEPLRIWIGRPGIDFSFGENTPHTCHRLRLSSPSSSSLLSRKPLSNS